MVEVKASIKNLRIAPRKVRLVADLIRKKPVSEAEKILKFTNKRAKTPLLKLLKSAVANAKHNFDLDPENLYIKKIEVNEGQKLKRIRYRWRGTASLILKRNSHINIVLEEIPKEKIKEKGNKK